MPPYKDIFYEGEVVLILYKEEPAFYARVESIAADRKKGWWQMTFLALMFPPQPMTWILDDDQMRGADFTMNGEAIRIERVDSPIDIANKEKYFEKPKRKEPKPKETSNGGKIVSLFEESKK